MKRYRVHADAARDLDQAAARYESEEPGLGAAFLDAYETKLVQAVARPRTGSPDRVAGSSYAGLSCGASRT
jgi:hypothetical protein